MTEEDREGRAMQIALLKKVNELKRRCLEKGFSKSGHNSFQNYDYYTESNVFDVANPIMVELGLIANYSIDWSQVGMMETWEKGYRLRSRCTLTLIDVDTCEEFHFGPIMAEGADNSDKAAYKMNTGAVRTLWCKFLGLSNHDEPEGDTPPERRTPSPKTMKTSEAVPKVWSSNSLFAAASSRGKLEDAKRMRAEGKSFEVIAKMLEL